MIELTEESASLRYQPHLLKAARLLERAGLQMLLFQGMFDHDAGEPLHSAANSAKATEGIRKLLKEACSELFERTGFEREYGLSEKVLQQLYGAFSMVAVCRDLLAVGNFGDGDGVTSSPVLDTMTAAGVIVARVRNRLDCCIASQSKVRSEKSKVVQLFACGRQNARQDSGNQLRLLENDDDLASHPPV